MCALLLALAVSLTPGIAAAELSNPFPEATQTTPTEAEEAGGESSASTSSTSSTSGSEGSNSNEVVLLAVIVAVVLIGAIAFVIMRDARNRAPVPNDPFDDGRTSRDHQARLQKRRAKAKAARQQRKRNR